LAKFLKDFYSSFSKAISFLTIKDFQNYFHDHDFDDYSIYGFKRNNFEFWDRLLAKLYKILQRLTTIVLQLTTNTPSNF
jgi:hypothetical protein